jgi:hypothetical protein
MYHFRIVKFLQVNTLILLPHSNEQLEHQVDITDTNSTKIRKLIHRKISQKKWIKKAQKNMNFTCTYMKICNNK